MYGKKHSPAAAEKMNKARTKFPGSYLWVHKKSSKELYKTCLKMGRLFDPYKQSSSFTKIIKGQMKSIYGWTLKEEVKHGGN